MTRSAFIVPAALLAGCTLVSYPAPRAGAPTAEIVFSKGHEGHYGVSGSQYYRISESGQCSDARPAATLLWTTPHSESAKVAAGRRIVVLARTLYFYNDHMVMNGRYASPVLGQTQCAGTASFVAEAGRRYDVSQIAPFNGQCYLRVTDTATGAMPSSFAVDNDPSCNAAAARE